MLLSGQLPRNTWIPRNYEESTGPHWLWHSGDLVPPLTGDSTWESRPCASTRQHTVVGLGVRGAGEQTPESESKRVLALPLLCYGDGEGAEVMPFNLSPLHM